MSFDIAGQNAASDNEVIAFPNKEGAAGTDLFILARSGMWQLMFAPHGVLVTSNGANLCVSEPSSLSGLVLRRCSTSPWQHWIPVAVTGGVELKNSATGDIVKSHGMGAQLVGVAVPATPDGSEIWHGAF